MAHDVASKTRTKVFVSCARPDAAFADQLGGFLNDNGVYASRDRNEIGPDRGDLIHEADAVVVVLTPSSAHTDACAWDVAEAQRLGKRVIAVLPAPLAGASPPPASADVDYIYFYSDPAVPHSGFFDGQKRLLAALRPTARSDAAERERREARRAAERQRKDEARREREDRKLAQRLAEAQVQTYFPPQRQGPRFPTFRAGLLGLFAAAVLAVIFVPGLPGQVRSMLGDASAVVSSIAPEEEPYSPMQVAVEEIAPERDLVAVRGGANVRDYPLTSGDLLANVPQGTRLRVTGRLNVQGRWWFRVVMPDERVGFVREDVVRWSSPERTTTPTIASNIQAIEPAVQIEAGRAGANLRTQPRRGANLLVRLPAGAAMNATGKVRAGGHWWLRVSLDDGRNGFVRDDVLTTASRAALDL
ncbi:MAG: SH3 domain-containing protein [Hyphomonadaceae bacterium]